jgi:hypothetical protein
MSMPRLLKGLGLLLAAGVVGWALISVHPPGSAAPGAAIGDTLGPVIAPRGQRLQTAHYLIQSSANAEETRLVADHVEGLYSAFVEFFGTGIRNAPTAPMKLYLYGTRREFKANNRSRPWAEAYYLRPICHAYFGRGEASPYHWMIHEATHQLSRELAGFPRRRWSDEGLATYFGTSRFVNGKLQLGAIDTNTYPVWWLAELGPTGNLERDKRSGRIVPLRLLITDEGKTGIAANVNGYYLAYWSLARFLLEGDGGRHAAGFRKVIAEGGSLESFERNIGKVEEVERDWYAYFVSLRQPGEETVLLP